MKIGKVLPVEITAEMRKSYLDYAMSVIVARALPDVRDGLKPVHRRILYAMAEIGLSPTSSYTKSAKVVGETMGKYHPHGDGPIYDALVRMAQDFSMRYPLVDGQGNFGCFTKDTKVKLTDGRSLSFGELIKEQRQGKRHWTFAFNHQSQKIEIAEIQKPRLTHKKAKLVEITLDNKQNIRCTPDHKFILRDGVYKQAKELRPGDSLMPFYTKEYDGKDDKNLKGYEMLLQPTSGAWKFIHRIADEFNIKNEVYKKSLGRIRHHIDFNKKNNNPDNITRMHWAEHWQAHYKLTSWRHKNDLTYVQKLAEGRKRFIEENREKLSLRTSLRNRKMWQDPSYREKQTQAIKNLWKDREYREFMRQLSSTNLKSRWQREEFRQTLSRIKSEEMKRRWQEPAYQKEVKERTRKLSLRLWSNPDHRVKISQLAREKAQNPQWRARQSTIAKILWQNPEYRAKYPRNHFSQIAQKLWANPQTRLFHRQKAAKQWQDPSFRAKVVNNVKLANKRRLEAQPAYMKELTEKAKKTLHKNWQNPSYKERVIKSRILSFVSSILQDNPHLTPQKYEDSRNNNGIPKIEKALEYFENFSDLVKQAQTYNHRVVMVQFLKTRENVYDLTIDKWHNFTLAAGIFVHNSVDGDPPAAMRYTEVRPAKISQELLADIGKDTVEFEPNFDASLSEPKYLPALLPNLLLMGAEGIAVGMATKIPPHNLAEVTDAVVATIKKGRVVGSGETEKQKTQKTGDGKAAKETEFFIKKIDLAVSENKAADIDISALADSQKANFNSDITIEELTTFIKGPDFPTGGVIYGGKFLGEVYGCGRGRIVVRGVAKIEEGARGKTSICLTELPYQVNKATLVARIAELARDKKLVGVADLRDESDRHGMSVVVELKKDARPKAVLNNLYKHTELQTTFPANFVALVDGTPHTLNLKQILVEYVRHRQKVVTRRSIFDLAEAKKRAHILEGLKIALDNLDEVISTIRKSKDAETAKGNLIAKFGLTDLQATAILDMQLRRLSALEREKIEEEYKKVGSMIESLTDLLSHPEKVLKVIAQEVVSLAEKYGDSRKTKIVAAPVGELSEEDLVAKEEVIVTITKTGYIKRVLPSTFRAQRRGGKGVVGMTTKEEDEITHTLAATTHDTVMFFTDRGRIFGVRVWEIPEGSRQAKGQAVVNLINVDQGEKVQSILSLEKDSGAKYLLLATKNGTVKRTALAAFKNLRSSGLIAIRLEKNDALRWVKPTSGNDHIILVTGNGKCIRFAESDTRPMGRPTKGVHGIHLAAGDEVVGTEVIPQRAETGKDRDKRRKRFKDIFVVMERGLGKRTPVQYFPIQKRAGMGVKIAQLSPRTGNVTAALLVTQDTEQVVITSRSGQVIKLPAKNIPQLGRATQGVILMRFASKTDSVAAVTTLQKNGEGEETISADNRES